MLLTVKTLNETGFLIDLWFFSVKAKQNDELKVISAKCGFDKIDDYLNKISKLDITQKGRMDYSAIILK